MIGNQEELRVSHEKVTLLQDELNTLRRQSAEVEEGDASQELHNKAGRRSDNRYNKKTKQKVRHSLMLRFSQQIQSLNEQLKGLRAESEAQAQNHSVETEELLNRVTSVNQERDLLQEALEGLMQDREQEQAELEARMEKLQTEVRYGCQVALSSHNSETEIPQV